MAQKFLLEDEFLTDEVKGEGHLVWRVRYRRRRNCQRPCGAKLKLASQIRLRGERECHNYAHQQAAYLQPHECHVLHIRRKGWAWGKARTRLCRSRWPRSGILSWARPPYHAVPGSWACHRPLPAGIPGLRRRCLDFRSRVATCIEMLLDAVEEKSLRSAWPASAAIWCCGRPRRAMDFQYAGGVDPRGQHSRYWSFLNILCGRSKAMSPESPSAWGKVVAGAEALKTRHVRRLSSRPRRRRPVLFDGVDLAGYGSMAAMPVIDAL